MWNPKLSILSFSSFTIYSEPWGIWVINSYNGRINLLHAHDNVHRISLLSLHAKELGTNFILHKFENNGNEFPFVEMCSSFERPGGYGISIMNLEIIGPYFQ